MMQPPSATVEPVVVNLSPPDVKVAAGADPVEVTAHVRNAGTTVDQFSVEIENLDSSWYTIMVQSVSLFPGDSAPIPIRLHPPKSSATRAGHYTFVVRARSHADPTLVGVTKGVITVGSYANFQMELAPKRFTGKKGKYRVILTNAGNSETQIELSGNDPEITLNYNFHPSSPLLQPGQKKQVPLTVTRKGFKLVGQQERYQFAVVAQPVDGSDKDAKEVQGELAHEPWFTSWRRPLWLLGILLLVLGWLIFRPDINPCSARFFLPSQIQFYSGFACTGGVLKPFAKSTGPSREAGAPGVTNPCVSGEGFKEVRKKYNDLVGGCVEDEWYDELNNSHQSTEKGQLMYIPKSTGLANIYFFQNDGKVFIFVKCAPSTAENPGSFNDCDIKEVTQQNTQ